MKLLDLFCCQGGASAGYAAAGFDIVVGVDLEPQPRYPYPFAHRNAVAVLTDLLDGGWVRFDDYWLGLSAFDAIHASPPCQAYTLAQRIRGNTHPDLVSPIRFLLDMTGLPYVIENVPGAPLMAPVELCGAMFGLRTYRHRLFESNVPLTAPEHPEHQARTTKMGRTPVDGENPHIVGNFAGADIARDVMGMPWATRDGLREAIPAAYTEHIGRQLIAHISQEVAA